MWNNLSIVIFALCVHYSWMGHIYLFLVLRLRNRKDVSVPWPTSMSRTSTQLVQLSSCFFCNYYVLYKCYYATSFWTTLKSYVVVFMTNMYIYDWNAHWTPWVYSLIVFHCRILKMFRFSSEGGLCKCHVLVLLKVKVQAYTSTVHHASSGHQCIFYSNILQFTADASNVFYWTILTSLNC